MKRQRIKTQKPLFTTEGYNKEFIKVLDRTTSADKNKSKTRIQITFA